jgi:hypothetical protein
MTLEDKIKLFGHFLYCRIECQKNTFIMTSIDANSGCVMSPDNISAPIEECKLILKPLSRITKKDAIKCAQLANLPSAMVQNWEVKTDYTGTVYFAWPGDDPNYRNIITFTDDKLNFRQVDFLRSEGYAIGLPKEVYVTENIEVI